MTPGFVIEVAERMAKKLGLCNSHASDIQWYREYADGREAPKAGIFVANWNNDQTRQGNRYVDVPGNIMRRLGDILERMGGELEWSDQVSSCDDCGRLIQTEPDCYSWQPEFEVGDGSIVCTDCMDPEEYLSRLADEHGFNSIGSIDPGEHGYVRLNEDSFETGWHPGQTDDPRKMAKQLEGLGVKRFLFHKDEQSQFYVTWSVYVPAPEASDDDDDADRSCADPQPSDRDV